MSKRKFNPSERSRAEKEFYNRISRSCLQRGWVAGVEPSHITINVESLVGQIAITQSGQILTKEQVIGVERQVTEAIIRAVATAEKSMVSDRKAHQDGLYLEKWFEEMYKRLLKKIDEEESHTKP